MKTVENLISDFHNLPGDTIQEKHKSFQTFITAIKQDINNKDDENKFIAKLEPRNKLEHLFRIDLLSHLKRNDELLEILKGGNKDYIQKVLKDDRFLSEVIPKFNANSLISNLFPQTSFVTKSKIINKVYKILKNEQLVDEYFEAVEEKYGLKMAFALLPGCSAELIQLKVKKYKPKLNSRCIIEICKKDPSFPSFYFNMRKTENIFFNVAYEYDVVINYIARKNIELFWKLQNEFDFEFRSGKHLTKKLILQNEEVLKDGYKCVRWFQSKKLYNTVNKQGKMQDFLLSFYQGNETEFLEAHTHSYSEINRIFNFITPEKRYPLIKDLFNKKYSTDILNYPTKFSKHFLAMLPLAVREPIVEKCLEKNDDYAYLLNLTKAISLIKAMLRKCSTSEQRIQKLQELCKAVEVNRNDKEKITEVFKFVFERYRNNTKVLKAFVYKVASNYIILDILDGEQLKLLNQMGTYTITNYSHQHITEKVSIAYLLWLFKNNRDYDEHLIDYLKRVSREDTYYEDIFDERFAKMKVVLEKIIDMIEQFKDDEKAYKRLAFGLINHIISYNEQHKKDLIPLNKYRHILEYTLNHGDSDKSKDYLRYAIKNYRDKSLHKYFWKHYKYSNQFDMLYWFLKNDVKQIEDNLELILSNPPNDERRRIYKCFGKYSTDSLKTKMLEYIKIKISFDNSRNSAFLVSILSCINSEEFLRITAPLMPPPDGKLPVDNAANQMLVQKAIIRALCNIDCENLLEIVTNVCVGDYLKDGIQPLYKVAYNMKEIDVLPLLKDLKESPVSVAKHSLLLSKHLLPKQEASEFIQKALQNQSNISMKNIIFKKSLDLFLDTQTDSVWKQLEDNFQIINPNDTAMLDVLINYLRKVPSIHLINYIQSTYDVIKRSKSKEWINNIISLAQKIPKSSYDSLPFTFLEEIIGRILREMFLHESNQDCFWDYIIYSNSSRSKRLLSFILETMRTIISATNPGYAKLRKPISSFTTSFCKKLLYEKNTKHKQLIKMFNLQWDFLPKHCLVKTTLYLKITVAYYESGFDLNNFAFLLNKLLHRYIKEYESGIILEFSKQLYTVCNGAGITSDDQRILAKLLLMRNDDKYNYILIINFLKEGAFPFGGKEYYKWDSIIKPIEEFCMKERDAAGVMVHYDQFLSERRSDYIWRGNQQFSYATTTKL